MIKLYEGRKGRPKCASCFSFIKFLLFVNGPNNFVKVNKKSRLRTKRKKHSKVLIYVIAATYEIAFWHFPGFQPLVTVIKTFDCGSLNNVTLWLWTIFSPCTLFLCSLLSLHPCLPYRFDIVASTHFSVGSAGEGDTFLYYSCPCFPPCIAGDNAFTVIATHCPAAPRLTCGSCSPLCEVRSTPLHSTLLSPGGWPRILIFNGGPQ